MAETLTHTPRTDELRRKWSASEGATNSTCSPEAHEIYALAEELERQLADKSGQWNREANCFLYKEHGGENGMACEALREAERQLAAWQKAFQHYFHDGAETCRQCGLPPDDKIHVQHKEGK